MAGFHPEKKNVGGGGGGGGGGGSGHGNFSLSLLSLFSSFSLPLAGGGGGGGRGGGKLGVLGPLSHHPMNVTVERRGLQVAVEMSSLIN